VLGMVLVGCPGLTVGERSNDDDGGSHRGQDTSGIHATLLRDEISRATVAIDFWMAILRHGPCEGQDRRSASAGVTFGSRQTAASAEDRLPRSAFPWAK